MSNQNQQTPQHAASLAFAAEKANELENSRLRTNDPSPKPPVDADTDVVCACNMVERAYKELYVRIQDMPDREVEWRNKLFDRLDKVSFHFRCHNLTP